MRRRRIGIYGASDESLRLVELLTSNPDVEIARVYHPDRGEALAIARAVDPALPSELDALLGDDADAFAADASLDAVIDGLGEPHFAARHPAATARGLQIVSPLTARLLWGYGVPSRDRKAELLQALSEVVESVELAIHSEELFQRVLEIAVGAVGADGGSLMLLDEASRTLRIRVALGVEPELWPKIRVGLGEGIAGVVAARAEPAVLRGRLDSREFQLLRPRGDVAAALCVPLVAEGHVLGVLNLHHGSREDAFGDEELAFARQLALHSAQIIARSQEHEQLRDQAARYSAVRDVHATLATREPLLDRLEGLCRTIARRLGGGVVQVYLFDPDEDELHLAATSLEGGGFGGEYHLALGQGIDGRAAQTRRPAFLREDDGQLAYAALPLLAGERLVGVLSLQTGGCGPRERSVEETLLEMAAAAAEEIAQSERETRIHTRANRMSALNETGIRMLSTQDLTEVARMATSSAAMILEADHALLRLQDAGTGRFSIRAYYGPGDPEQQRLLFKLDKQVAVDAIKRRSPRLVRDVPTDSAFGPLADGIRSLVSAPLKRNGRVVGTLALYDKVSSDRFYAGRFNDEDFQVFARFVSYVERAVASCEQQAGARRHRNFDEQTGLPNESYLAKRIHEEIARAVGREDALALAVCRLENLEEIARHANPAHAHRVVLRTADALRAHVRDFDVVARSAPGEFTVLMPEPGASPGERVFALARAVADAISKDDTLNDPVRVALAFGYAVHPSDGSEREALVARARDPRIRMV